MDATIRQATIARGDDHPRSILHHLSASPRRIASAAQRYDGLFDIFPESYWVRFSSLESVALRCHLRSPAKLRLIRRQVDGAGVEKVLQERTVGSGEVVLATTLAPADAPESSLVLEVLSEDRESAPLLSAAWETTCDPVRPVRLGVAITTFNREPFLVANLRRLRGHMAGGCVIVVNHGPPGLEARLRDQLPPDPAIRWIDQENSGGAGGFTRGMVEHHAAGNVTHILLMDDDIDLPTDLIERLTAILSHVRSEFCLGGAMFDYHHRTTLFSAGDVLIPDRFGIGHIVPPGGCDIATSEGVDFLARVHEPDFNGWWCFAFPIEAINRVGLPMPCFIRGDDVEYGYRLKRAGMPTLGWPGLAVWHMPFDGKSAPWQMFYDRRNSLFTNALHRRVGRWAAIKHFVSGFTHHLLRYDYDRVRAMTLGIAAFNAGPRAMARWTDRDHAALIAATSRMQDGDVNDADANGAAPPPTSSTRRLSGSGRTLRMIGRLMLDLTGWPIGSRIPRHLPPGEIWRPDLADRPALAVECDDDGQPVRIYRRDAAECRRAVRQALRALMGMLLHFHQQIPCGQAVSPSVRAPSLAANRSAGRV